MQITVKRLFVFPSFAALLLLGCSSTKHPTITITPASPQAAGSFVITGMGFSSGTPGSACAQLTYTVAVGSPGNQSGTPVPINSQPSCDGNGGFTFPWTPPQISGCTAANNTVYVNAKDLTTGTLAEAPATAAIVCEMALCPGSLSTQLMGTSPNQTLTLTSTSMPQYFASGCTHCGTTNESDYPSGPTGLSSALNFSTCSECITSFTLTSSSQSTSGSSEKCSYQMATPSCPMPPFTKDTSTMEGTANQCTYSDPRHKWPLGILPSNDLTLTFNCPDSGGCSN